MKDSRLLESYVKEVIQELKINDIWKGVLSKYGNSSMEQHWLTKLYRSMKGHGAATKKLEKMVNEWLHDYEAYSSEDLTSGKKREIFKYAVEVYAKMMKKYDEDESIALKKTEYALDRKFGRIN